MRLGLQLTNCSCIINTMNKYDIQPQCEEIRGTYASEPANEDAYEHRGWPGDGSGMDDLQDFMQNEGGDW